MIRLTFFLLLQPAPPTDPKVLQLLIAQVGSDTFKEREVAIRELNALGEQAIPAIRGAIDGSKATLEQQRRLDILLLDLETPAVFARRQREIRAVEVLERVGNAEARSLLESLSGGAPHSLPTVEARLALDR